MVLRYPLIMSYEFAASACLLSVQVCSDEGEITMLDYVRFGRLGLRIVMFGGFQSRFA